MKVEHLGLAAAGLLLPLAIAAASESAREGERLYRRSCVGCHGTEVFTRAERKVRSLPELRGQLDQCAEAARTAWGAEEKAKVLAYLNESFYRFRTEEKADR